jgi:lipopolysaccharide export system permease protein
MRLHRYFAWRFLLSFLGVFAIFFAMLWSLDLIDQVRRFAKVGATLGEMLGLTFLNVPQAIYRILPLIMIIAAIALFLALARSSEMVVTRAAGRSALRALWAPVIVALVIGCLAVGLFNPIVAATSKEYEARAGALTGESRVLALSGNGIWLRQAEMSNLDGTVLTGVTFITFAPDGTPSQRIEAEAARLTGGAWSLSQAKVWPLSGTINPEADAVIHDVFSIPSTLTPDQIRDSFGTPSSIPIWELPGFIDRLQAAGFTARRHEVFLQGELASPVFLVAMVLIAAGFTLRHQRGGRTGIMVLGAILLSFGAYFLRNFAQILGETGQIPVLLAAWAPPLAAIGLSLGLLLHMEDG